MRQKANKTYDHGPLPINRDEPENEECRLSPVTNCSSASLCLSKNVVVDPSHLISTKPGQRRSMATPSAAVDGFFPPCSACSGLSQASVSVSSVETELRLRRSWSVDQERPPPGLTQKASHTWGVAAKSGLYGSVVSKHSRRLSECRDATYKNYTSIDPNS